MFYSLEAALAMEWNMMPFELLSAASQCRADLPASGSRVLRCRPGMSDDDKKALLPASSADLQESLAFALSGSQVASASIRPMTLWRASPPSAWSRISSSAASS